MNAVVSKKVPLPVRAYDSVHPLYLRIGDWNPDYPYSGSIVDGKVEAGLSVYALDQDRKPITPPWNQWAGEELCERLKSTEPKHYVQGELVGEGSDGEPLLWDVHVVLEGASMGAGEVHNKADESEQASSQEHGSDGQQ